MTSLIVCEESHRRDSRRRLGILVPTDDSVTPRLLPIIPTPEQGALLPVKQVIAAVLTAAELPVELRIRLVTGEIQYLISQTQANSLASMAARFSAS